MLNHQSPNSQSLPPHRPYHVRFNNQIKASVLHAPLTVVGIKETTALGAALLGGLGAGVYTNLQQALADLSHEQEIISPIVTESTVYEDTYQTVYQRFYQVLQSLRPH